MDTIADRVQSAYDRIANVFDQYSRAELPPRLAALGHAIIRQVGAGGRILDVGCGTGAAMAWFEARGLRVTGLDLSAAMLALARGRTTGPLVQAMLQRQPLAPARFDAAWCSASLLHVPKRELPLALQELRRVVRAGGLVMISLQLGDGERWDGGYVEGVLRFFARYQPDELRALLAASGLAIRDEASQAIGQRAWITVLCQVGDAAGAPPDSRQ